MKPVLFCKAWGFFPAFSWPDLYDRVERAEDVTDVFWGVGIVPPASIHEEFIFVTTGRKCQPFFPQARVRIADHAQAGRMPVVEITADIDVFRAVALQNKINIAAWQDCGGRFYFHFVFPALLLFRFLHK